MGLFSFLFGGKKKAATRAAEKPTSMERQIAAVPQPAAKAMVAAPMTAAGVAQAKLRLKLAASLRSGERAAAYEAAKGLAEIQVKAGRKTAARVWSEKAERIRAGLSA